ncbi:hypothetical protein B0H67DRAFT_136210 [Lasiosphaeris hirsuta]|uniref:Uncharacterized protein n=1 Tax=Lasiosphaeris hirsuta TaxID=260670 RepID=A0AA40B0Z3_9PEZI|nr:hypothetical protein B0H67DRAFT_136210 [Lasiosphaeris hirsuta]
MLITTYTLPHVSSTFEHMISCLESRVCDLAVPLPSRPRSRGLWHIVDFTIDGDGGPRRLEELWASADLEHDMDKDDAEVEGSEATLKTAFVEPSSPHNSILRDIQDRVRVVLEGQTPLINNTPSSAASYIRPPVGTPTPATQPLTHAGRPSDSIRTGTCRGGSRAIPHPARAFDTAIFDTAPPNSSGISAVPSCATSRC